MDASVPFNKIKSPQNHFAQLCIPYSSGTFISGGFFEVQNVLLGAVLHVNSFTLSVLLFKLLNEHTV